MKISGVNTFSTVDSKRELGRLKAPGKEKKKGDALIGKKDRQIAQGCMAAI